MSRGVDTSWARCALVWSVVSVATATATSFALRPAVEITHADADTPFDDLLVHASSAVLLAALAWLWVITTATLFELARGRTPRPGGATRRLVHLACGVALAAGVATPAVAQPAISDTPGRDSPRGLAARLPAALTGLGLPDRVATPPLPTAGVNRRAASPVRIHVVRRGDSLSSIADTTRTPGGWGQLWSLNQDVVGTNPDLILPGQRLILPLPTPADPDPDPDPDPGRDHNQDHDGSTR